MLYVGTTGAILQLDATTFETIDVLSLQGQFNIVVKVDNIILTLRCHILYGMQKWRRKPVSFRKCYSVLASLFFISFSCRNAVSDLCHVRCSIEKLPLRLRLEFCAVRSWHIAICRVQSNANQWLTCCSGQCMRRMSDCRIPGENGSRRTDVVYFDVWLSTGTEAFVVPELCMNTCCLRVVKQSAVFIHFRCMLSKEESKWWLMSYSHWYVFF